MLSIVILVFISRRCNAGFITGALFSLNLAPIRIAFASVMAFLFSQLMDIKIFDNFRDGVWFKAPLISTLFQFG